MTDIFISYAHEDQERVGPIVKELEMRGWIVFWDRNIPPGETWESFIGKALEESCCVLAVWSRYSVNSDWVKEEADEAKQKGILVPLFLDTVDAPRGFRRIQAADISGWKNNSSYPPFQKLITAIESKIALSTRVAIIIPPNISFQVLEKFVFIHGGEFVMGSPKSEVGRCDNETQHMVRLWDYHICKYAVTVAEFKRFIDESAYKTDADKENGSYVTGTIGWKKKTAATAALVLFGAPALPIFLLLGKMRAGVNWHHDEFGNERLAGEYNHPVLHVSWNDAVAYSKWLSEKLGKTFRLPTEAEWEYACRTGTSTPFSTGDNLKTSQANYNGNYPFNNNQKGIYRKITVSVDSYASNAWGLYNMHGNVSEWCSDFYDDNYYDECAAKGVVENPAGPVMGLSHVCRGGSWNGIAGSCRSANRTSYPSDHRTFSVGFRLVFVP